MLRITADSPAPEKGLSWHSPSRSAELARGLLADFKGTLLTDGYQACDVIAGAQGLVHAGCLQGRDQGRRRAGTQTSRLTISAWFMRSSATYVNRRSRRQRRNGLKPDSDYREQSWPNSKAGSMRLRRNYCRRACSARRFTMRLGSGQSFWSSSMIQSYRRTTIAARMRSDPMMQRLCADCGQKQDTGDGALHDEGLDTLWPVTEARLLHA